MEGASHWRSGGVWLYYDEIRHRTWCYQFPLLLFSSSGRPGMQPALQAATLDGSSLISITLIVSLCASFDYWAVEIRQRGIWMPLAETIRKELPTNARIVSITGSDPTLLNLARRQGWIIPSNELTRERLQILRSHGASHLTGSIKWQNTYTPAKQAEVKKINQLIETNKIEYAYKSNKKYLIPISNLMP